MIDSLKEMLITCNIMNHTKADNNLCVLGDYIRNGFPSHVDPKLTHFINLEGELTIMKGCTERNLWVKPTQYVSQLFVQK